LLELAVGADWAIVAVEAPACFSLIKPGVFAGYAGGGNVGAVGMVPWPGHRERIFCKSVGRFKIESGH
jgi:hypothetical protein